MNHPVLSYPPLFPAFAVRDAAQAIAFYQRAFGATELYRLTDPESGKVGHVELRLNGGLIMLGEENPAYSKSPQTLGGTPVKICLMVENVDASAAQAAAAGATVTMAPSDQFYGYRTATLRDPFGHEWMLQHEIEKVSPAEMQRRWNEMMKKC